MKTNLQEGDLVREGLFGRTGTVLKIKGRKVIIKLPFSTMSIDIESVGLLESNQAINKTTLNK